MYLFPLLFSVSYSSIPNQSAVFGGKHVNVYPFYFLILIEVCDYCLRAQPNRFARVYISARWFGYKIRFFICSFGLMSYGLSTYLLVSALLVSWTSQLWVVTVRYCEYILTHFEGQPFVKSRKRCEGPIEVNLYDRVSWDVGSFLVESTLYKDIVIDHKAAMAKPVHTWEPKPVRRVSVVDVQGHWLPHLITPSSDDQ
jgi:hypothetical protein